MAEPDHGIDIYCVTDFLPDMPLVSGRTCLVQNLARRLQTKRGGPFPWWPNYGLDLRRYVGSKMPPSRILADAITECLKDERVNACTGSVERVGSGIELNLRITDGEGPFDFTMSITEAAATLISLNT